MGIVYVGFPPFVGMKPVKKTPEFGDGGSWTQGALKVETATEWFYVEFRIP
jgi:hypothetical protein